MVYTDKAKEYALKYNFPIDKIQRLLDIGAIR